MPTAAKSFGADRKPKRKSAWKRGYDSIHRATRSKLLRDAEYICVVCGHLAEVADHIVPHRGKQELLRNEDNYQALCKACHDAKTRRGE